MYLIVGRRRCKSMDEIAMKTDFTQKARLRSTTMFCRESRTEGDRQGRPAFCGLSSVGRLVIASANTLASSPVSGLLQQARVRTVVRVLRSRDWYNRQPGRAAKYLLLSYAIGCISLTPGFAFLDFELQNLLFRAIHGSFITYRVELSNYDQAGKNEMKIVGRLDKS